MKHYHRLDTIQLHYVGNRAKGRMSKRMLKKIRHAKLSGKWTFLTLWYAHVRTITNICWWAASQTKVWLNYCFSVNFNNFYFHNILKRRSIKFIIRHFNVGLIILCYCCFCWHQNAIVHKYLDPCFCYIVTQIIFQLICNGTKENNLNISGFVFGNCLFLASVISHPFLLLFPVVSCILVLWHQQCHILLIFCWSVG